MVMRHLKVILQVSGFQLVSVTQLMFQRQMAVAWIRLASLSLLAVPASSFRLSLYRKPLIRCFATKENDSLSHLVGSHERYAQQLGLTVDELQTRRHGHREAAQQLHETILSTNSGPERHKLLCEHRFRYGKHPFVCHDCWCPQPICVCDRVSAKLPIPVQEILLPTHHGEWTSRSNSGCLLGLQLENTRLLLRGLEQHDEYFEKVVHSGRKMVVLWPDNGDVKENRISWEELQASREPFSLIAMEGTWKTARRMLSKLPSHVQRVAVPPSLVYWKTQEERSILYQLRRQEGGDSGNLCTAEAVIAALVGLGMPHSHGNQVLDLVRTKVDLTRRYYGKSMID